MISGLSNGLLNDGVSFLKNSKANSYLVQSDLKSDSLFTKSKINLNKKDLFNKPPLNTIKPQPFGLTMANSKFNENSFLDLTLVGTDNNGFMFPKFNNISEAEFENGIVLSKTAKDEGVSIGEYLDLKNLIGN